MLLDPGETSRRLKPRAGECETTCTGLNSISQLPYPMRMSQVES